MTDLEVKVAVLTEADIRRIVEMLAMIVYDAGGEVRISRETFANWETLKARRFVDTQVDRETGQYVVRLLHVEANEEATS